MKQASVLDLLASPTGRNVALLRVSHDRDLELLRHHLAPAPEAESWFSSDIVKRAAGESANARSMGRSRHALQCRCAEFLPS